MKKVDQNKICFGILFSILLSICFQPVLFGQNKQLDSLLNCYKKADKDSTRCRMMFSIADKYENISPDSAILWYNKLYTASIKATNSHDIFSFFAATSLREIGWVECGRGNYKKAIDYARQSLKVYETLLNKCDSKQILNDAKREKADCYKIIGIVNFNQGSSEKAIVYYAKALNIYEEIDYKNGIPSLYSNIGYVYSYSAIMRRLLEYYEKSLKIAEEIGDEKEIISCYTNISWINVEQKLNYEKAMEYCLKALKIC